MHDTVTTTPERFSFIALSLVLVLSNGFFLDQVLSYVE